MFGKDPSVMQMLYNFVNIGAITRAEFHLFSKILSKNDPRVLVQSFL